MRISLGGAQTPPPFVEKFTLYIFEGFPYSSDIAVLNMSLLHLWIRPFQYRFEHSNGMTDTIIWFQIYINKIINQVIKIQSFIFIKKIVWISQIKNKVQKQQDLIYNLESWLTVFCILVIEMVLYSSFSFHCIALL